MSPRTSPTPTTTSSRASACADVTEPEGSQTRITVGDLLRALNARTSGASAQRTETPMFHFSDYRRRAYPRRRSTDDLMIRGTP